MGANVSQETWSQFPEAFQSKPFQLVVGPSHKNYTLHKEPVSRASNYFKVMLVAKKSEIIDTSIELDGEVDDETAFDMFVQFAYLGEYNPPTDPVSPLPVNILLHARVYVLAEKIDAPLLKKLALKKATEESNTLSDGKGGWKTVNSFLLQLLEAVPLIYEYTPDADAGKLPGTIRNPTSDKKSKVERDGFRLLLAHFCAFFIDKLRKMENFFPTIKKYPDLATDILMFTVSGGKITIYDGKLQVASYF